MTAITRTKRLAAASSTSLAPFLFLVIYFIELVMPPDRLSWITVILRLWIVAPTGVQIFGKLWIVAPGAVARIIAFTMFTTILKTKN
jgi:hypothetical protein